MQSNNLSESLLIIPPEEAEHMLCTPSAQTRSGSADGSSERVQRSRSWDQLLLDTQAVPNTIGRIPLLSIEQQGELTKGASMSTTIFNLVSTCLGSGMLALPAMLAKVCTGRVSSTRLPHIAPSAALALHTLGSASIRVRASDRWQLGIGGGLCLIFAVPLIAERTVASVLFSSDLTGQLSLAQVAEQSLGRVGAVATACALVSLPYGVCVSYCVVIKSLLPRILQLSFSLSYTPNATLVLATVSLAILVPLTSLKTMEQLRFASLASILLVYSFVAAVAVAGLQVLLAASPETWHGSRSNVRSAGVVGVTGVNGGGMVVGAQQT